MSRKLCLGSGRPTIRQILQHLTICVRKLSDNGQSIQDQANYYATCGRDFSYCRVSNTQVYRTVQKLSGPYNCRKMLGDLTNCVQNNKNVQLTKCSAYNTYESVENDITDIHTYDVQCHDKELCMKNLGRM
jgi:hypothetical protein